MYIPVILSFYSSCPLPLLSQLVIHIHSLVTSMCISFSIFQSTAYLIDVYRTKTQCERNFFRFALFVSFFPQLVQGPISRHSDLAPRLFEGHKFSADNFMAGGIRVAFGYFKIRQGASPPFLFKPNRNNSSFTGNIQILSLLDLIL